MTDLADLLRAELGDEAVLAGTDIAARSAGVMRTHGGHAADLLARPADTAGVARVLALCHANRQPVVVHGGLTGLVGGAQTRPGDLMLSLERLTGVEEVDPIGSTMTVRAGTTLQTVQEAAAEHSLMFPLDLGARGSATIGGNASTNAGGSQVIRYGMMRALVLGVEAVLADGTVVSSMNTMLKNNAGYDLKQLFIGSEGTLGVVTRLVLRLVAQPASRNTALVAVPDFAGLCALLVHLRGTLADSLSSFEAMWPEFYAFSNEGLDAIQPGRQPPLAPHDRYYALVEAQGHDAMRDDERFEAVLSDALETGLIEDAVIAKSGTEREALWAIREDVARLLELKPLLVFDISLSLSDTEAYVAGLRTRLADKWPNALLLVFGHLGDGNIHLAISAGDPDGSARGDVEQVVYEPLQKIGGSVSAEHGIGLEKKPYLKLCRTPAEIELMRALKKTLDPLGILNPGKIFDNT